MEVVRQDQDFSGMRGIQVVQGGFFRGTWNLILRGLGLGIVLFLALSTLAVLNQVRDVLGEKLLSIVKHERPHAGGVYPVGVSRVPSLAQARPPVRPGVRVGETIRESGYFLRSLDDFARSLSRLAHS